ncbi:VanZ family protein [Agromyces sp. NPDC056965]|uniref:VanZ family protein n=1 Tax=Agromyces sp. NPDC056965 TaxID=3345983 RepID=UPI00363D7560
MSHATARNGDVAASGQHRGTSPLLVLLFAVYLVLLAWIILWKLEVPFLGAGGLRHVKLVPFVASGSDTASEPLEVAANFLLFVPFGAYLVLLRPSWPLWKHVGALAGASLLLEIGQYALAVGSSDATDVIANTSGGITGLFVTALLTRRLGASTIVVTRICLVGTAVTVLACLAFFASPLHYGQRDVPPAHSPSRPDALVVSPPDA